MSLRTALFGVCLLDFGKTFRKMLLKPGFSVKIKIQKIITKLLTRLFKKGIDFLVNVGVYGVKYIGDCRLVCLIFKRQLG